MGQGRQHIHFGKCKRRLPDAPGLPGNGRTQFGKQPPFDLDDFLLGIQNLRLVFFQLRRGKALGIDQGLLALIVRRRQVKIGF